LLEQTHDGEFRAEAINSLRQIKNGNGQIRKDRYSDESTLAKITTDLDRQINQLLGITGEWTTANGNGIWKFSEADGPTGKMVRPGSRIPFGNIGIVQAYSSTPATIGFMWRNSELELEGWYAKPIPGLKCNGNLWLFLKESEDGNYLTGSSRPAEAQKGCTYASEIFSISLRRK
jgi:hypothetical protein